LKCGGSSESANSFDGLGREMPVLLLRPSKPSAPDLWRPRRIDTDFRDRHKRTTGLQLDYITCLELHLYFSVRIKPSAQFFIQLLEGAPVNATTSACPG